MAGSGRRGQSPRAQRPIGGAIPRGISLIEAMVVLAIAALLLALALPGLGQIAPAQRVRAAGQAFIADLHWARSQAVARGVALQVEVQRGPMGPCWVIHEGRKGDCRCALPPDPDDATDPPAATESEPRPAVARESDAPVVQCTSGVQALRHVTLVAARGVTMQSTSAAMRLAPRLGTVTPTGSLTFQTLDGRAARRHVVGVLGRVRSCAPGAATWELPAC